MLVLCQGCGMRVLLLADGSCPSCGAHGELETRVWQGKSVETLVPSRGEGAVLPYACVYLRPFARRFRAAARMRAVAEALRPYGKTVALHDREARAPFGRIKYRFLTTRLVGVVPIAIWNLSMRAIEAFSGWRLERHGVELVDARNDGWQPTFRRLALRSRLIVMDTSASAAGLAYEAGFISDLGLANRLLLLHDASRAPESLLLPEGLHVVNYRMWALRRLTADLRQAASGQLGR
jgi:hypothetical protein